MSEQDDRYLYALAELDNLRKRSQKDVAIARDVTRREVLLTLLPLVDDLERAVAAASAGADPAVTREGLRSIAAKAKASLASLDVQAIESVGKPFVAELMEAIAKVPAKGLPAGQVAAEVTRGYKIGDTLLRPAQVAVSEE
jgi:molecular chaperone GrpE